jgi:hypothetical protein
MPELIPDERRDYYRILDQVGLSVEPITGDELPSIEDFVAEVPDAFQLVNHLTRIEADSSVLLHSISDRTPEVGRYLKTLNSKIEAIAKHIVTHNVDIDLKIHQATLSAGGISFDSPIAYPKDSLVRAQMVLYPSCTGILTYCKVVRCQALTDSDGFDIALEYQRIQETDRDALVRHVLQLQSNLLRQSKNEN